MWLAAAASPQWGSTHGAAWPSRLAAAPFLQRGGLIGAAWLSFRQQYLPYNRGAQELCRAAFKADCSAFPRGRSACDAAHPSWMAAAPRSMLGVRPGKSKRGTRTWEVKCFLERPQRAGRAQRLSPCWWRSRILTMGRLWAIVLGKENLPVVRSVFQKAPSLAAMPGGHRQQPFWFGGRVYPLSLSSC